MNTLEASRPGIRETEKNALVLRLEMIQKDVDMLREQLNSYRCEPRTYSLFERLESLRNGLDTLTKTNNDIITAIREKRKQVDFYVESAKRQFTEFQAMHKNVEDYIQGAISSNRDMQHVM